MSKNVEIAARLAEERERLMQQNDFAQLVGVTKTTQSNYERAERSPDTEYLARAAQLGIDVGYVITGVRTTSKQDDTFVVVPMLAVTASAGNGHVNEDLAEYRLGDDQKPKGLSFQTAWLAKRRLNPKNLRVIDVRGSSMEPVLSSGDLVLVDLSHKTPRGDDVYVIRQGEDLLVKYCQLLPSGVLRVSSANQSYLSYDIELNAFNNVEIVGRVVASMHEW